MRLRRRLIATIVVSLVLGLALVDAITLTSLHSYLYGRVDDQLSTASGLMARFVSLGEGRGYRITPSAIQSRVGPDTYVELIDRNGRVQVARPSGTGGRVDAPPSLPSPLRSSPGPRPVAKRSQTYHPSPASIDVPAAGGHGPEYRLQATSVGHQTLVVAAPLDEVNATLDSFRRVELAVSAGLLAALLVLITVLVRLGLRPLEDMTREADAIAAGDLTRRVQATEGHGEIPRLGRALNGMLAQIETAFAQRARSEERLRSFLADASHELRTPLTSIQGYAELLRKEALADPAARSRALSRIEKEAARMGELVGDLALLAREGEGRDPPRSRVDLAAVAAEVVADAETIDASRHIALHAPNEVPVAGDDARLGQLVQNLLGNALAHTPAGTPVEVGVAAQGERAVLEVRDRGPGMTAEQARHVFDRFYRGDADRLDGGSGLGLFIVASLARSFGGKATVDTAVGRGSTFQVVLPLYRADPENSSQDSAEDSPEDSGGGAYGAGLD